MTPTQLAALDNRQLDEVILRRDNKRLFVLYADIAEDDCDKAWLIDKMLGCGEMSAVYGPPGCGKGVGVEDMDLHIAAGLPWHGRPVTQGAVLYIALERKMLVQRRAAAFRKKHGLPDLPFAVLGGTYDFRNPATAPQILDLCKQVEDDTGERLVKITIDTVSRALSGGDENSPRDMGALIATTSLIQERKTVHVQLVHHIPHDSDRLRGHGSLLGAVDTTLSVSNNGGVRSFKVVKANDSEEGESIAFKIESVQIGRNGTTAPVAIPLENSATPRAASSWQPKLRLIRDCIAEAVIEHCIEHRIGGDGLTVKAAPVARARAIHSQRYVHTGIADRGAAERQAWTRNFKVSQNSGLIAGAMVEGEQIIWMVKDA